MNGEVTRQTAVGAGVCGVLLLVCGAGCLIPGFVLIANDEYNIDGLWSGVLLLIAGVLGVITWWKRHRGVIIGFLVVTVCVLIAVFLTQSITAGARYSDYKIKVASWHCYRTKYKFCYCKPNERSILSKDMYCDKSKMDSIIRSLLTIVIFSVISGIASFTGSIFGCMGTSSVQNQPGAVVAERPVLMTTVTVQQPDHSVQPPGYQEADANVQATSCQQQVSDDPPPQYTVV